jgi:enoyl-CoA hydratase/carnithine racemase
MAGPTAREYAEITVQTEDPLCVITLCRPEKLNALTYPMLAEIRHAVDHAAADPAVVAIVITGSGRGFCSGLDADVLKATAAGGSTTRTLPPPGELPGMFSYLLRIPKPVIAAVNGVAAGGGLVLATMCDLRFAAPEAAFTVIFSKRGLSAEHGTSWILPRLVGTGRSLDLLWTSRKVDAAEAYRIGLVEYLCDPGMLLQRVGDYIRELAATVSPASIADAKEMVYRHVGMGYAEALPEIDAATWAALDRPDATEGALSLLERRAPRFPRLGT